MAVIEDNKAMIDYIKKSMESIESIDDTNLIVNMTYKPLEIMEFKGYTDFDEGQQKIITNKGTVKRLYTNDIFENVFIVGVGIGNYKGIYIPIQDQELVLVGWIDRDTPVILGSVNNYLNEFGDNIPPIRPNEVLITNRKDGDGSVIYMKDNNDVMIKHPNNGKLEVTKDGVKANNYISSNGSPGITTGIAIPLYNGGTILLMFRNGILTEYQLV